MKLIIQLLTALLFIHSSSALDCKFLLDTTTSDYICELTNTPPNNDSTVLTRTHINANYTDVNVTVVRTNHYSDNPDVSVYSTLDGLLTSAFVNLRSFGLRRVGLTTVSVGAFENCEKMQEIDLSVNGLTDLPAGVFANCTHLRKLTISMNYIAALNEDVFEGLNGVEELLIVNNRLKTLEKVLFTHLTGLKHVSFSNNSLTTVDTDTFGGLVDLKSVDLSFNHLTELNLGASSARIFNISHNSLNALSIDSEVEEINLSVNVFTKIPQLNFSSLRVLKMSGNSIEKIEENALKYARNLEVLDINTCGISSIDPLAFYTLDSLREVHLYHNRLSTIYSLFRSNLASLETIDLSSNALPHVSFGDLKSLKTLKLAHNSINSLNFLVSSALSSLEVLDISGNKIQELRHVIALRMPPANLSQINLSYNPINSIERGYFAVYPRLTKLGVVGLVCANGDFGIDDIKAGALDVCYFNYESQHTTKAYTTPEPSSEEPEDGISPNKELVMAIICIIFIAIMLLGLVWYIRNLMFVKEVKERQRREGKHVTFENNDMNYKRF